MTESRIIAPLRPQDITCESREQWLERRGTVIGASEAPIILGVGYAGASVWGLWHKKLHPELGSDDFSDEMLEKMEIGTLMEPTIREVFRRKEGLVIEPDLHDTIRVSPHHPFMGATLDGLLEHDEYGVCVAELKNIGAHNASDWDDDAAPLKYEVQLQQQLEVMQCNWGVLVALIGGERLAVRWRERDERFIEQLVRREQRFWEWVETGMPPVVDHNEPIASDLILKMHPDDNGDVVPLPDDAEEWIARREQLKALVKRCNEEVAAIDNQLKAALGPATYGLLHDGSCVSWKTYERKPSTRVVKGGKGRTLRFHKKLPRGITYQPKAEQELLESH